MGAEAGPARVLLLVIDGVGDVAIPSFGDRTPLEVAHVPHLDAIAGKLGAWGVNAWSWPMREHAWGHGMDMGFGHAWLAWGHGMDTCTRSHAVLPSTSFYNTCLYTCLLQQWLVTFQHHTYCHTSCSGIMGLSPHFRTWLQVLY